MVNKTYTSKLSKTQWEDLRSEYSFKGMLGGSDMGTIVGVNQYKSAVNLFYEALGLWDKNIPTTEAMYWGTELEEKLRKDYAYWDGSFDTFLMNKQDNRKVNKVQQLNAIIENDNYPMLFANIDGNLIKHRDIKGKGVLEIKTISSYNSDKWQSGLPPSHEYQLQSYMLVLERDYGEIFALKDGRDMFSRVYEANIEMQQEILEKSYEFYFKVNEAKKAMAGLTDKDEIIDAVSQYEPSVDPTEAYRKFMTEKAQVREMELHTEGDDYMKDLTKRYLVAKEEEKISKEDKDLIGNEIRKHFTDNGIALVKFDDPDLEGTVTYRGKRLNVNIKNIE